MKSFAKRLWFGLVSLTLILGVWPLSRPSAQELRQCAIRSSPNLLYNGGFEEWGPRYNLTQTPIQPGWPVGWMIGEKWESDGWVQPGGEEEWFPLGDSQAVLQTSGTPRDEGGHPEGRNNGTYAVYLGNPNQTVGYSIIKQIVPVTPGAEYELSFYTFGWNRLGVPEGDVDRLAVRAYVWFLGANMMPLGYPNHAPSSFNSPPGETPGFGLMIKLPDGGIGVPPGYTQFSGRTAPAPAAARYAEIQFGRYSAGGACIDDVSFTEVPSSCPNCVNFDQLPNGMAVANGTRITTQYQASSIWPSGVTFKNPGLVTFTHGWLPTSIPNAAYSGDFQTGTVLDATFSYYGLIGPFPGVTDCVSFMLVHASGDPQQQPTVRFQAFDRNGNLIAETLVDWKPANMRRTYSLQATGIYRVTLPIPPQGMIDDFCFGPVTSVSGQADLVVKDLRLPFGIPTVPAGSMTLVTFKIVNQGTESAGPAKHELHLLAKRADLHGGSPVDVDLLLGTVTTGTLAAGASASFQVLAMIPQDIVPGPGKFRVVADAANAVSESNETNNTAELAITITGGPF